MSPGWVRVGLIDSQLEISCGIKIPIEISNWLISNSITAECWLHSAPYIQTIATFFANINNTFMCSAFREFYLTIAFSFSPNQAKTQLSLVTLIFWYHCCIELAMLRSLSIRVSSHRAEGPVWKPTDSEHAIVNIEPTDLWPQHHSFSHCINIAVNSLWYFKWSQNVY